MDRHVFDGKSANDDWWRNVLQSKFQNWSTCRTHNKENSLNIWLITEQTNKKTQEVSYSTCTKKYCKLNIYTRPKVDRASCPALPISLAFRWKKKKLRYVSYHSRKPKTIEIPRCDVDAHTYTHNEHSWKFEENELPITVRKSSVRCATLTNEL